MSLINLPTEIITQIIGDTLPDGYESLMLSCRTIHDVGKEYLERHNSLCRRFKRFKYDTELQCSLQLLHCIGKDPLIADYIKTADFFNDPSADDIHQRGLREWNSIVEDRNAGKTIKQVLGELNLSNHTKFAPRTRLDAIALGELAVFATTVVLGLLPNLEELVLPKQWAHFPPSIGNTEEDEKNVLWRALESIVREATIGDNRDRPLSKLARVHLLHPVHYVAPLGLQHHLSPFLILPSLRELCASNCLANRAYLIGKPFLWRYPSRLSTLEKIEFASSCVEGPEIANLLKHTPRLRSFKLSYESKSYGCGTHLDMNRLFLALRNHCADTLMELSITVDRVGTVKGGLRSLKEFTKLERLELDVCVFFGPEVTGDLLNMPPVDYRNYAYGVAFWNGTAVPCLADILPSTVEWVRLITGSCREDILIVKSLVAHLDTRAADCLPQLQTLIVSRATLKIGNQFITAGQPAGGWKSVGDVVSSAGFHCEEREFVRACWLDEFHRRPRELNAI